MECVSCKPTSEQAFQTSLVFTTERETFALKVCLRENEGRWLAGHRREKKKRPNNCWSVKVWDFFFSFYSQRKRKLSRSRDCEMLFFASLFQGTRKPEKPWLQQFSNHPISKLRSFRRPFGTFCGVMGALPRPRTERNIIIFLVSHRYHWQACYLALLTSDLFSCESLPHHPLLLSPFIIILDT